MPFNDKDAPKMLSSPLSDSVELDRVPLPAPLRTAGWLDALHGARTTAPPPPAASAATSGSTQAPQRPVSSAEEHTPLASRQLMDGTAVAGSPIPVNVDESEVHMQELLPSVYGHPRHGDAATSSPGPPRGLAPVPAPRSSSSPTRQQQIARLSTLTQSPQSPPMPFPAAAAPVPTTAPSLPLDVLQRSPFGDSHVAAASAQNTTSQWWSDGEATTVAGDEAHSPGRRLPVSYSSALMQALSRTEGAAALTSQWTSTTHRGGSDAYDYSDEDRGNGSSDIPPDMYEEAMRAKVAKQQWVALEKARQEVLEEARRRRDCPFAPRVSEHAARLRRPASLRPENRVTAEVIRRKQWVAKKQQEEVERELQSCTFRPLTLRTAKLDPAILHPPGGAVAVFHHLYTEAEDRRTFERDVKPQLVQQLEEQRHPSPPSMRPTQLAAVVERLCARGVVRSSDTGGAALAPYDEDKDDDGGGGRDDPSPPPNRTVAVHDAHQPALSQETQRIVAAQLAAGERDGDIVRQLYRNAEQDAMRAHLRRQVSEEQERLARAERATALAEDRKLLQQEFHRSVLVAKFRALAQHASRAQRSTYRTAAPQSVVLLARAALDVLSADEAEELLGAVEHCGRPRLTEAEFVVAVLRYLAEQQATPATAALLRHAPPPPPPALASRTASASALKRAGAAVVVGGSADSSPAALPRVKREKPDPAMMEHIRARRAQELQEWKEKRERQRAISDGVLADGSEYTFQPAPRRLIPYACRPDVAVPVRSTKSEALRRAHTSAHRSGAASVAPAADTAAAAAAAAAAARTALDVPSAAHSTARELFLRGASSPSPARSHSGAPAAFPTKRPTAPSPAPSPRRSAKVNARSSPARGPSPHVDPRRGSYAATLTPPPALDPCVSAPAAVPAPTARSGKTTVHRPDLDAERGRNSARAAAAPSLLEHIAHSSPEERVQIARELLVRQLREHQRRTSK
ncbi:hypothetical protein NESM_000245800 [Novymonas esmeraldas]|uniref:Uncharacterized protein n=1 Tax=Novymonas esmeraldas TaxID=1808958 RepID=A0AAW0FBA1_9TRYP